MGARRDVELCVGSRSVQNQSPFATREKPGSCRLCFILRPGPMRSADDEQRSAADDFGLSQWRQRDQSGSKWIVRARVDSLSPARI